MAYSSQAGGVPSRLALSAPSGFGRRGRSVVSGGAPAGRGVRSA